MADPDRGRRRSRPGLVSIPFRSRLYLASNLHPTRAQAVGNRGHGLREPKNATKRTQKTPSKPGAANPKRRAAPQNTPGAPTKQTPPDGRTNGRGVTGVFPRAAGVPYAPKPRATQTPPPLRTKRPPGQTSAKAGRTGQGNGRQRSRANPASKRHQTDEQAREGAPPDTKTGQKNETRDPRRAAAAERTICRNEANRPQAAFAGRAGLLREPFLRLAYSPEGVLLFREKADRGYILAVENHASHPRQ